MILVNMFRLSKYDSEKNSDQETLEWVKKIADFIVVKNKSIGEHLLKKVNVISKKDS